MSRTFYITGFRNIFSIIWVSSVDVRIQGGYNHRDAFRFIKALGMEKVWIQHHLVVPPTPHRNGPSRSFPIQKKKPTDIGPAIAKLNNRWRCFKNIKIRRPYKHIINYLRRLINQRPTVHYFIDRQQSI